MSLIAGLAPVFVVFEVAQLVVAHRYIGPAQIQAKLHPLDAPVTPPFWLSVGWMTGLWADYAYQAMLFLMLFGFVRLLALLMIVLSVAGFMTRRHCGLKWGLVVMTFEGALRIGIMLGSFILMTHPLPWGNSIKFF